MNSKLCIRCCNCNADNWIEVVFDTDCSFKTVLFKPKCSCCDETL